MLIVSSQLFVQQPRRLLNRVCEEATDQMGQCASCRTGQGECIDAHCNRLGSIHACRRCHHVSQVAYFAGHGLCDLLSSKGNQHAGLALVLESSI